MIQNSTDFIKTVPEHGPCFICGSQNPHNVGLRWQVTTSEDKGVLLFSQFSVTIAQQGPPGHAHGGASAAVLDESMGCVCFQSGYPVLVANLNVNYHLPVPLNLPLLVESWVAQTEGRKVYAQSHLLLPGGETAVSAKGLFIHSPNIFRDSPFQAINKS